MNRKDNDQMETKKNPHWVLLPYAAMVVFGWWVPNDLLAQSPNLSTFCDFMASIIPQIDRVTVLGGPAMGNANRVIYSVLWVVAICAVPIPAWRKLRELKRDGFALDKREMPLWLVIVAPPFFLWTVWNALHFHSFDTSLRAIHFGIVSRFGSGLMAPVFIFGTLLLAFAVLIIAWGLLTGRLRIGDKK